METFPNGSRQGGMVLSCRLAFFENLLISTTRDHGKIDVLNGMGESR
jgi:hypothetical protein